MFVSRPLKEVVAKIDECYDVAEMGIAIDWKNRRTYLYITVLPSTIYSYRVYIEPDEKGEAKVVCTVLLPKKLEDVQKEYEKWKNRLIQLQLSALLFDSDIKGAVLDANEGEGHFLLRLAALYRLFK